MKRAFTFLMSLFLVAGTMWAQTEATRMTAEQLNAVTERKAIAIECTQITNYNRYYDHVNGDSYGLTSGMNSTTYRTAISPHTERWTMRLCSMQ